MVGMKKRSRGSLADEVLREMVVEVTLITLPLRV